MARTATILTIFLASPGDVSAEREVVARSVTRWNSVNSLSKSVIFELLRWEDNVAAGFGRDGQDVINRQIPPYDLLIALFWTRLGTPTPRSNSGTSEEYEIALSRFSHGENVEISFYFKDSPFNPREVDLDQLSLVYEFEKRVQSDGAFTKRFINDESLGFEIDFLLDKVAIRHEYSALAPVSLTHQHAVKLPVISSNEDLISKQDDIGLFDISDNLEKHGAEATRLLGELTDKLIDLTGTTAEVTSAFSDISASRQLEPNDVKPLIKKLSEKMNEYSQFSEERIPLYSENVFLMSIDIRNLVEVSGDFAQKDESSLENLHILRKNLESIIVNATISNESMMQMRENTAALQRTTSEFNKAKRRMIKNIDDQIDISKSLISTSEESIFDLDKLIFSVKSKKD